MLEGTFLCRKEEEEEKGKKGKKRWFLLCFGGGLGGGYLKVRCSKRFLFRGRGKKVCRGETVAAQPRADTVAENRNRSVKRT